MKLDSDMEAKENDSQSSETRKSEARSKMPSLDSPSMHVSKIEIIQRQIQLQMCVCEPSP